MKICTNCKSKVDSLKSVIRNGKILNGCDKCIRSLVQGDSARYYREIQKKDYRRDLTQPSQTRDYIKAYPDKARDIYPEDVYRKFS